MTETYCRSCNRTVHITHDGDDCPASNDPNLRVPTELRAANQRQ